MSNFVNNIPFVLKSFFMKAWSIKYICIRKGKGSEFALEIEAIEVFHYCAWSSNVAMIHLLQSAFGYHAYLSIVS